jgi:hypothetical protein
VCPTDSLCVAADDGGNVFTSSTPPFNAATWSTSAVDRDNALTGLTCSSNLFCLIGDEGGNVIAGTLIAPVNPAVPPPVVATPKPSCTIRAKSARVLLPPAGKHSHRGKTRGKIGTLSFVVRCDQTAGVTLHGTLTELLRPKHGRKRSKSYSLSTASHSAPGQMSLTLTIKLPRAALTALIGRAHESVTVTLSATNANGTSATQVKIANLKPVAT